MIDRIPFGSTGHHSSRVLFGAAAMFRCNERRREELLQILLELGVNHIDTAADYGDSELHVGQWMKKHRDDFFLATKTGERTADGARASIARSLERLEVEQIDLIQLHNLVDRAEWETALGPGGALEATIEARDRGLVRFIGVTGHGWDVARRHIESLERFPFDSVLFPLNYPMMTRPEYARDVEELLALCHHLGVAVQTIKALARRRWPEAPEPRFSWYEPVQDEETIVRCVRWVLARPGIFLASSSDSRLLRATLQAASESSGAAPTESEMAGLVEERQMEPLFEPGENAI